jgi:dipeptidase E
MIIASTSTLHNSGYLEYLLPELSIHFKKLPNGSFIPYARPSGITHDEYTQKAALAFTKINITLKGIHEYNDPIEALQNAEGILPVGNTFYLLHSSTKTIYLALLIKS